jgi:outer membrane usher protein
LNPLGRDIDLTVPLTYRRRVLGEVPVLLTRDDRFLVKASAFLELLAPLLNEVAAARLREALAGRDTLVSADLAGTGIQLDYDPAAISVVVLRIDPTLLAPESLFEGTTRNEERADLPPSRFSAYLNANVVISRASEGETQQPGVLLNGAVRLGGVVFEADFQGADDFGGGGYRVDRNFARFVYDQPLLFRRWFLGDLSPEIRGRQSFVQLGGAGVARQRRRFDPFRNTVIQGDRRLVLQRNSTVSVYRNGVLFRELRLESGAYDLSNLPLITGSNDVEIRVRDDAGGVQNLTYGAYLDPIDLDPGDYEYGAYLGVVSDQLGRTPVYDGDLAFSGYFRKAFLNRPAIGLGLQASSNVQLLSGQTQLISPTGGRFQLDGAVSNSNLVSSGYAAGASYDQILDRGGLIDSFTIRGDYTSEDFAGLANPAGGNTIAFTFGGQYTRAFTPLLSLTLDASYLKSRGDFPDSYRLGAFTSYRFSRQWSLRSGVDYTSQRTGLDDGSDFGVRLALVFEPSFRDRAEAQYESRSGTASVSYNRASEGTIGSVGYGVVASREEASAAVAGFADYTGNRFDASVSHAGFGSDFSGVTDQQVTTLRLGTSVAYAGGAVGVGRRVTDSFAIIHPHPNLGERRVVAGQSLEGGAYLSKSGPLGGALNGFLTSYVIQPVQYDVENPPAGYDIGPGVVRVRPAYRSGYALRVGTDDFVSATGTLVDAKGAPVSLTGGRAIAQGVEQEPLPFFTNSVGRFALQNLRPGTTYRVELFGDSPVSFQFSVPSDNEGLLDLKTVRAPINP